MSSGHESAVRCHLVHYFIHSYPPDRWASLQNTTIRLWYNDLCAHYSQYWLAFISHERDVYFGNPKIYLRRTRYTAVTILDGNIKTFRYWYLYTNGLYISSASFPLWDGNTNLHITTVVSSPLYFACLQIHSFSRGTSSKIYLQCLHTCLLYTSPSPRD